MATYAISFRIADKGNKKERYDSFIEEARNQNEDSGLWEETTSFILIKSNSYLNTLVFALSTSKIDKEKGDKFIVINTDTNEATHYGIEYPSTFSSFFR